MTFKEGLFWVELLLEIVLAKPGVVYADTVLLESPFLEVGDTLFKVFEPYAFIFKSC